MNLGRADCAGAELAATATAISAVAVGMTSCGRLDDILNYVDYKTDDRSNEEKRENRMQQGYSAYPRRGNRDIGGLIAQANRKSIVHEVVEVCYLTLGKL